MKKVTLLALLAAFGLGAATVALAGPGTLGDDNPYPLACMNFSGSWQSDSKEVLHIEQGDCKWLTIRTKIGPRDQATTIVPDDKSRSISGSQWTGQVRHRWNSKANATIIETHRELTYADHTVEELVLLEKVNPDILLESTYRTIKSLEQGKEDCAPRQEYEQRMFRRLNWGKLTF
jgi:hypothetical protein